MHVTHFGHSCILVDLDGTRVLFDPGVFSHGFAGISDLDAILITHQHPDHADLDALPELLSSNPTAALYADPQTTEQLNTDRVGGTWTAANPGDEFTIGSVTTRVRGGEHAVIHPDLPNVDNVAYLLSDDTTSGTLMHPGDSLFVPEESIDVLAIPCAAPWMKLSEGIDYLRAVSPRIAFPIHEAVLSDPGRSVHQARMEGLKNAGTEWLTLPREDALDIS